MNTRELDSALRKMTKDEFRDFVGQFGGDHTEPDSIVRSYVDHPEWEPRLCQLLGFLTENEKNTKAVIRASAAAMCAAALALMSAMIAVASLILNWCRGPVP